MRWDAVCRQIHGCGPAICMAELATRFFIFNKQDKQRSKCALAGATPGWPAQSGLQASEVGSVAAGVLLGRPPLFHSPILESRRF